VKLQSELFRRGYQWIPLHDDAREEEYSFADKFFQKVNKNNQGLLDVLRRIEDDLNIIDDAYFIVDYNYTVDSSGSTVIKTPKEFYRGDPLFMRPIADEYGNMGGLMRTCLLHREQHGREEYKCRVCGRPTYDVHYVSIYGFGTTEPDRLYVADEVIHLHKYEHNLVFGYSPVASFWRKAYSLIKMDEYVQDAYELQRSPKAALFIPTDNPDSLQKLHDKVLLRRQENPHYMPWIATEPGAKNQPAVLRMDESLLEQGLFDLRREYRERISAFYGVSPVMQGDVSVSGGLNNEGLQFAVTNRAVEYGQNIYNNHLFPFLVSLFNITDWRLELLPSEEEDEMAELQREQQKLHNARLALELGLGVQRRGEEYIIEDGVLSKPETGGFSFEPVEEAEQSSGVPGKPVRKEAGDSIRVIQELKSSDFPVLLEFEE